MISIGLLLAFISAISSAVSHAFLKAGEDKLAVRVWACLVGAVIALPVALWSGPLPRAFWGIMAAFAAISALNQLILARSYRISDFSAAYPVARGVVPLAMAGLGVVFLGDRLSLLAVLGIVTITAGIVALALGKGMSRAGWAAAILTGLTTIGYNLLAAKGMRDTADPINFLAWLFVFDGLLAPMFLFARTGRGSVARLRQSFAAGWPPGILILISFSTLAFAMRLAPVGPVSAIRESSVLIGLVLAALMLKERLDRWRIGAGLFIVAGAIMLVFA